MRIFFKNIYVISLLLAVFSTNCKLTKFNFSEEKNAKPKNNPQRPADESEGVPGYLTCLVDSKDQTDLEQLDVSCNFVVDQKSVEIKRFSLLSDKDAAPHPIDLFDISSDEHNHLVITFKLPSEMLEQNFRVSAMMFSDGRNLELESCPMGYALVKGDQVFGTKTFCVMKYEAKQNVGNINSIENLFKSISPIRTANLESAKSICQNLGQGYSLISNEEWMTVATLIASLSMNWNGGAVGSGEINQGHSDGVPNEVLFSSNLIRDPCFGTRNAECENANDIDWIQKRTHLLTNGEEIWDFSGNVSEIVLSDLVPSTDLPISPGLEFRELNSIIPTESVSKSAIILETKSHDFWNDVWDSRQGLGKFRANSEEKTGNRFMVRGGEANYPDKATGIFTLSLTDADFHKTVERGFRCVYHLEK